MLQNCVRFFRHVFWMLSFLPLLCDLSTDSTPGVLGDLADAQEALPATLMAHSSEGRFAGRVIAPGHVALVQVLLSLPSEEFLGLHRVCRAPGGEIAVPRPQGVQGILQGGPRCKRGLLLLLLSQCDRSWSP